jgi:hypothetical protein
MSERGRCRIPNFVHPKNYAAVQIYDSAKLSVSGKLFFRNEPFFIVMSSCGGVIFFQTAYDAGRSRDFRGGDGSEPSAGMIPYQTDFALLPV